MEQEDNSKDQLYKNPINSFCLYGITGVSKFSSYSYNPLFKLSTNIYTSDNRIIKNDEQHNISHKHINNKYSDPDYIDSSNNEIEWVVLKNKNV